MPENRDVDQRPTSVQVTPHSFIQSVPVELRIPQGTRLTASAPCGAHNRETVTPGNRERVHEMASGMSGEGDEGWRGGTWLQIEGRAKVFTRKGVLSRGLPKSPSRNAFPSPGVRISARAI